MKNNKINNYYGKSIMSDSVIKICREYNLLKNIINEIRKNR